MISNWFEPSRFENNTIESSEWVARIVRASAKALFVFFAPLVLVANLWVFYVLYQGIGLTITVAVSTILFAGIFGYVDTQLTIRAHSKPSTLALVYLSISFGIHLVLWALL